MTAPRSRFVLGTAQLGMPYGLNNSTGQPSIEESFAILDQALAAGINTFDTAFAYGNAEEVLGSWITQHRVTDVFIVSKLKPHVLDEYRGASLAETIKIELKKSLARLHLSRLDGYLLHTPQYLYEEGIVEGLQKVKTGGLTSNIGVSIYDEDDALEALDLGVDYIQVPYNILDQRLDRTDFFRRAKKAGVTVFARSPFLQGLLLMEPEHIPPHLSYARPHLQRFRAIAKEYGLSPLEASLAFVNGQNHIEHIVFGVERVAQLSEILSMPLGNMASLEGFRKAIKGNFRDIERAVVNPSLWSNP